MQLAFAKPLLWVLASALLVGATVGGVVASLHSHNRVAPAITTSVPLYGSNG